MYSPDSVVARHKERTTRPDTARVHFTEGEWLKSIRNAAVFVIVAAAGTLFRHNAVLFTLPLFLAVCLYISKKRALVLLLCFAGLFWAVKYPLYDSLNVQRPHENRQIEACGLLMTVIGNAVKEAPERLDDEILDFAYTVAPKEIWQKQFEVRKGWDNIKFLPLFVKRDDIQNLDLPGNLSESDIEAVSRMDIQAVERTGWKKILVMALRCFKEAPFEALRGFIGITAINYGITGSMSNPIQPFVAANPPKSGLQLELPENNSWSLGFMSGIMSRIIPGSSISLRRIRGGEVHVHASEVA